MCEFSVPELNGCDFNCSGHSVLELNKKGETRVTYGASLIYLLREEPRDPGALVPKERKEKKSYTSGASNARRALPTARRAYHHARRAVDNACRA
jgi:hypothetical protein